MNPTLNKSRSYFDFRSMNTLSIRSFDGEAMIAAYWQSFSCVVADRARGAARASSRRRVMKESSSENDGKKGKRAWKSFTVEFKEKADQLLIAGDGGVSRGADGGEVPVAWHGHQTSPTLHRSAQYN